MHAFESFRLGAVHAPNRIVFPAWQVNYAHTDGSISDKLFDFYETLAKGGCGIITTGCAVVSPDTIAFDRVMRLDRDEYIPSLKKLFTKIEEYGSVPAIQLIHYGRQALSSVTGSPLLAPSNIPCPVMSQFDPHYAIQEMTLDDIAYIQESFIMAARRAIEAGAKMIEIHGAHGYLLNQFLSPYSNKRMDAYGGCMENRTRLIRDIIKETKDIVGDRAIVAVRVSGHEFVEGGLCPEDYQEIIPVLEEAGMDLLHVSAGVYASMERIVPSKHLGNMPHINIVSTIKQYTKVPVCAVGSFFSISMVEEALTNQQADLVAMGRAQMADPEFVKKAQENREQEIQQCLQCNGCTFWTTGDPWVYCRVNPKYKK